MTPLFVMAGVLLLVSGAVKLRTAERAELGLHLWSLLEMVVGICLPVVVVGGGWSAGAGFVALGAALLLLLGSSAHLAARLRRRSRLRERTEGRRLETYVRYISDQEDGAS